MYRFNFITKKTGGEIETAETIKNVNLFATFMKACYLKQTTVGLNRVSFTVLCKFN